MVVRFRQESFAGFLPFRIGNGIRLYPLYALPIVLYISVSAYPPKPQSGLGAVPIGGITRLWVKLYIFTFVYLEIVFNSNIDP